MPEEEPYLSGTASLISYLDKKLLVLLRDGKTFIGTLQTIDQYANVVLASAIERIHVGNKYGDIPRGVYLVRGENVVLMGEINETENKGDLEKVSFEEILILQKEEHLKKEEAERAKKKYMESRGMEVHSLLPFDEAN